MKLTRREIARLAAMAAIAPGGALAVTDEDLFTAQLRLIFSGPEEYTSALETIGTHGGTDLIPGLIIALRFTRGPREPIERLMIELAGEDPGRGWFNWMLWQEKREDVIPHPSYSEVKRLMFLRIDPNFAVFLKPEYLVRDRMKIRLEEITWGGVVKDGIPSLDHPTLIAAADASYLRDDDLVFGVSINGDTRAYPLRIMGWHEMFNEVIGGVPVALAYCTLCGSGILFETSVEGRNSPFVFGSSGFLYRSNKLMFDRETHSLWNQFTGQPVVGPLTDSGITLAQRPIAIDTWSNWQRDNPWTRVLALNTGFQRDYGSGVVYRDYFASPDLMFPTQVDESQHAQKDYVFGIRMFGGAKAWPLTAFKGGRVLNDRMLDTPLVLIGDHDTRTVRAYERGDLTFTREADGLTSSGGTRWSVGEDALTAEDGTTFPRVAGHIAYWFAWNGYLGAESELYGG